MTFNGFETFRIATGSGNDTITVGNGLNNVKTGTGNDTITGGDGSAWAITAVHLLHPPPIIPGAQHSPIHASLLAGFEKCGLAGVLQVFGPIAGAL